MLEQNPSSDQWDDPEFAQKWDRTTVVGNPIRPQQLDLLISILEQYCSTGDWLLDLGIGSALVEEKLFARRPDLNVVGVDSSEVMLSLAKKRLSALKITDERCQLIMHDLSDIHNLTLPKNSYRAVISIQTLHHLPHEKQREVIECVFRLLDTKGVFIVIDRVLIDVARLGGLYKAMWIWLEDSSEFKSGWSSEYFLHRVTNKEDHPVHLENQMSWLQQAGFVATCLHLSLDRALIAGIKKP